MKHRKLYDTWRHMINRCTNYKAINYKHYGGKGITVCDRWLEFDNFKADMLPTMKPELTLDRIDNNGNYEPSNCRWSDSFDQNRNTKASKWWYIEGVRYDSKSQAAYKLGVDSKTIVNWCGKGRWSKKDCYCESKYAAELWEVSL